MTTEVVVRTLHVCSRNESMGWGARKSLESPASVSSSVVFVSSVQRQQPLWTRSVRQAILQAMGLLRERAFLNCWSPRKDDERSS